MKRCGKQCEIYSRVTGYFRPLSNWNAGKKEEFRDRVNFRMGEKHLLEQHSPQATA